MYIEGRITYRTYDDRDGNKRYVTEIVASEMKMLGGRSGDEGGGGGSRPAARPSTPSREPVAVPDDGRHNPDDDIPF